MGHPAFRTVKQRTAYIAGLMERGEWVPYRTARELAADWSLALSTVRDYSANASHGLTLGMDAADLEAARARNWLRLDEVYELATKGDVNGRLALRSAVAAIELQSKMAGLLEPVGEQGARAPTEIVVHYGDVAPLEDDSSAPTPEVEPEVKP